MKALFNVDFLDNSMVRRIDTTKERQRLQRLKKRGPEHVKADRVKRYSSDLGELYRLGVPNSIVREMEQEIREGKYNMDTRIRTLGNRVRMLRLVNLPINDETLAIPPSTFDKMAKERLRSAGLGLREGEIRPFMISQFVYRLRLQDIPKTDEQRRVLVTKINQQLEEEDEHLKGYMRAHPEYFKKPAPIRGTGIHGKALMERKRLEAAKFLIGEALSRGGKIDFDALRERMGPLGRRNRTILKRLTSTPEGRKELSELFMRNKGVFADRTGIAGSEERFQKFLEHQRKRTKK